MDRDQVYLLDILEAARLATSYVEGMTEEEFLRDTQRQDSVIPRIEIIGEAARRISPRTRESNPEIPWTEMNAMRNLMIHDYDSVDIGIVWETVQKDIRQLISLIEPLVPPEEQ